MSWPTLSPQQTRQTRISVAKFLYTKGTNVALFNASRQKKYKDFEVNLARAIKKQLMTFASPEGVYSVTKVPDTAKASVIDLVVLESVSRLLDSAPLSELFSGGAAGFGNYFIWSGGLGGQAAFDKMGIDVLFGLQNPDLINQLRNSANLRLQTVDLTTRELIASTISEGKANNLTNAEIAQMIRDEAEEISAYRAKLIAETETATAMSKVEAQAYLRNGIDKNRWLTSIDDRVDDVCLDNEDAGYIDVGTSFPSGDTEPPAHPNCRCYLDPLLPIDFKEDNLVWTGD